ncbi:DUF4224 domain-containing protein [Thiorhodovibrio litoralis]|uniref:DUF4224 domain-containing protein n=1 Tax=Thiorhodovibrio litoralis TaxID=2952932 RepID=UPI003899D618
MIDEPFFPSDEDIADLTGYVRTDKQCEHLRQLGIPFFPDRKGRPRVAREMPSAWSLSPRDSASSKAMSSTACLIPCRQDQRAPRTRSHRKQNQM